MNRVSAAGFSLSLTNRAHSYALRLAAVRKELSQKLDQIFKKAPKSSPSCIQKTQGSFRSFKFLKGGRFVLPLFAILAAGVAILPRSRSIPEKVSRGTCPRNEEFFPSPPTCKKEEAPWFASIDVQVRAFFEDLRNVVRELFDKNQDQPPAPPANNEPFILTGPIKWQKALQPEVCKISNTPKIQAACASVILQAPCQEGLDGTCSMSDRPGGYGFSPATFPLIEPQKGCELKGLEQPLVPASHPF